MTIDFNDDEQTDRLDFLSDRHAELFYRLDKELDDAEFFPEFEPTPLEMAIMDASAEELRKDFENADD